MLKTKPLAARRFQLMALEHVEKRAQRIKQRREELRLTQEQVAERMQEAHSRRAPGQEPDRTRGQMVSDWERAVNDPRGYKLELLAEALETTVAHLETDPPSEESEESPLDALSKKKGEEASTTEVVAAVEALRLEMVATRTRLLAEIGKVQAALKARPSTGSKAGRR